MLVLIVVNIDIAISTDGDIATTVCVLVIVGTAIVAETRDVAAHLRPPAATGEHQERFAATCALLLWFTCTFKITHTQKKKEKSPLIFTVDFFLQILFSFFPSCPTLVVFFYFISQPTKRYEILISYLHGR